MCACACARVVLLQVLSASKRQGVPIHEDHTLGLALSIAVGMSCVSPSANKITTQTCAFRSFKLLSNL